MKQTLEQNAEVRRLMLIESDELVSLASHGQVSERICEHVVEVSFHKLQSSLAHNSSSILSRCQGLMVSVVLHVQFFFKAFVNRW